MRYLRSTLVGIVEATATGIAVLAYRIYQSSQSPRVDVHVADFYFARWIPLWAAEKGAELLLRVRLNAPHVLVLAAFVIGFYWEYYRASDKAGIPQH